MRLLTAISIVSLVVSIAAVVFVLGLYEELEKSEPETPKVHTQELTEWMVARVIEDYAEGLIKSAGITEDNQYEMTEVWESLPGFNCIWHRWIYDRSVTHIPDVREANEDMTYNYDKQEDIWLVTTYDYHGNCEELTTWAIDDNTGEVTYGHPDEK
jgi:hypothetical protein